MPDTALLYPMLTLVIFTFAVALWLLRVRSRAVDAGLVQMKFFRTHQGDAGPEPVAAVGRAFANLFEVPPLFHIACLAALVVQAITPVVVALAWAYVALRIAQTLIHLTYNNILHRLSAYLTGWLLLLALWVAILLEAGG